LCDALLERHPDREICILNNGGIRRDFPAGAVTYGVLYNTLPFGNVPAYLEVTGEVLRDIIRLGTSGAHGVVQVAGLKVHYDLSRDACPTVDRNGDGEIDIKDRDRLLALTHRDGSPLDPDRIYRVLTNSFLASGGDGWSDVLKGDVKVLKGHQPLRDDVAAWIRQNPGTLNTDEAPLVPEPLITTTGQAPSKPCGSSAP
jgi:2',3'-cyclic-nucleotide 2'-phosphodiesterase (5'-nucleotidase family)